MRETLMLITVLTSLLFGLLLAFVPGCYLAVMQVPQDLMTPTTSFAMSHLGVSLLVLAMWIYIARGLTNEENIERMMGAHALGWGILGVGGFFVALRFGDPSAFGLFFMQSAFFVVVGLFYYSQRKRGS